MQTARRTDTSMSRAIGKVILMVYQRPRRDDVSEDGRAEVEYGFVVFCLLEFWCLVCYFRFYSWFWRDGLCLSILVRHKEGKMAFLERAGLVGLGGRKFDICSFCMSLNPLDPESVPL